MQLLNGWKQIAEHLNLTVRTAQRWEKFGLPVHRVYESRSCPVFSTSDEIESWTRRRKPQSHVTLLERNRLMRERFEQLRIARNKARRRNRRLVRQVQLLTKKYSQQLGHLRLSLGSHSDNSYMGSNISQAMNKA